MRITETFIRREPTERGENLAISQNLSFLFSYLETALHSESMSGNAGVERMRGQLLQCKGVRAYADGNGQLQMFGTYEKIKGKLGRDWQRLIFRTGKILEVSQEYVYASPDFILQIIPDDDRYPSAALRKLTEAATLYNVATATDWRQLNLVLDILGRVTVGKKLITADEIKKNIAAAVAGASSFTDVIAEYGIRDKVQDLTRNNQSGTL